MEIRVAKTAGFCFGVKRAVDLTYGLLNEGCKVATLGPLIHNPQAVEDMQKKGALVADAIADVPAGYEVVIRSHGVPRTVYDELDARGITYHDATCPFVQKIQRLVQQHTAAGEEVFVTGNPEHPEVIGIMGWAEGVISAIPDIETAEKLPNGEGRSVVVVSQTTFNIDKFKLIIDILKKKHYYVNAINTICNATFERQSEAKELAKQSDAMIVIGGRSSSNTKKLFEICKDQCRNTQLIQTVGDLNFVQDEAVQNVGITAGASTPKEIIEEVQNYVRDEF